MDQPTSHDLYFRNKFLFVLITFVTLTGLAHVVGLLYADYRQPARESEQQSRADVIGHDPEAVVSRRAFYFARLTFVVSLLLAIPAFCFYVLQRRFAISSYWLSFWAFSYLAFLVCYYWATRGPPLLARTADLERNADFAQH